MSPLSLLFVIPSIFPYHYTYPFMVNNCTLVLVAVLLVNSLVISEANITNDRSALLAFKTHISLDPHGMLSKNWTTSTPVCNWIGVSCSTHHQRVTTLNLTSIGLRGTLPPHIGNLSFLSYFDISNNSFHGHLPSELSQLHRLKFLNFSVNNFIGELPPWFGILPKLQYLILANNSFTGLIPPSICNLTTLEFLNLKFNFLQGNVPEQIGFLPKLKWLLMGRNKLLGSIPSAIFNISSLQGIDFTSTTLFGSLLDDMCSRLPKLKFLFLSFNELYGKIPSTIGECSDLQLISLSHNRLTGLIPRGIGNLTMLQKLYLGSNNFKESDESQDRDPLHVPDGPITRARAKKIKVAMQGFVQASVDEFSKDSSNFSLSKMGLKEVGASPVYLLQARNEEELQVGPCHNGLDRGAHWAEPLGPDLGPTMA